MKNLLKAFVLFIFLSFPLYSEESKVRDYLITAGESITVNLCAYTAQGFFSPVAEPLNLKTIKKNMNEPWIFDNSNFFRNQFAHPYLGGLYFNTARSNNLNFIESFFVAGIDSFVWEYFLGNNAINDLIITTYAGSLTGEVLHRLGECAYELTPVLGWILSPVDGITQLIRGERPESSNGKIWKGSFYTGFGYDWYGGKPALNLGTNIVYENPYGHKSKEFLDQFSINGSFYSDFDSGYGMFSIRGSLYSWDVSFCDNLQSSAGIGTNYQAVMINALDFSSSDIGAFYRGRFFTGNNSSVYFSAEGDLIFLGAQRSGITSVYGWGFSAKLDFGFSLYFFTFNLSSEVDYLFPEKSIYNQNALSLEFNFSKYWSAGLQDIMFINTYEKLSINNYAGLYVKFKFAE